MNNEEHVEQMTKETLRKEDGRALYSYRFKPAEDERKEQTP